MKILPQQSVDQAGFTPTFSCNGHLFVTTMIFEKAREYQQEIFVAAVDSKKAFDTISHESIWTAMRTSGVPEIYVSKTPTGRSPPPPTFSGRSWQEKGVENEAPKL